MKDLYNKLLKRILQQSKKNLFNSILAQSIKRITGADVIHCLGDSHVLMFQHISRENIWLHTIFHVYHINGATALGLANPNSKTNALHLFRKYIENLTNEANLLLCLGEVDCGFVIWYRANKYMLSINSQFDRSLKNYFNFINWINSLGIEKIIVCSAPLPTIRDGQKWGEVANLRKEIKVSIRDRTDLTIAYNENLRNYCKMNEYQYLDIQKITLDPQTNLIREKFRCRNPLDHHLSNEAVSYPISRELKSLGYK